MAAIRKGNFENGATAYYRQPSGKVIRFTWEQIFQLMVRARSKVLRAGQPGPQIPPAPDRNSLVRLNQVQSMFLKRVRRGPQEFRADDSFGTELGTDLSGIPRKAKAKRKRTASPRPGRKRQKKATQWLEYTPQLKTPAHRELRKHNARFDVTVYLDDHVPNDDAQREGVRFPDDAPDGQYQLTVELSSSPHYRVENPASREITIRRGQSRSSVAAFTVSRTNAELTPEGGILEARFYRAGLPCGMIRRAVGIAKNHSPRGTNVLSSPVVAKQGLPHPDGIVEVQQMPGTRDYRLRVIHPYESAWENLLADQGVAEGIRQQMDQLITQPLNDALTFLRGIGANIYEEMIPANFKQLVSELLAKPNPSLLIASDETVIPWELLLRQKNGVVESLPLGARIAIGRWRNQNPFGIGVPPLLRSALVGRAADNVPLAHAADEMMAMKSAFNGRSIEVFDAFSGSQFRRKLAAASHPVVHFIGHGDATTGTHVLCIRQDRLCEQHITGDRKLQKRFAKVRPLVFLNACMAARPNVRYHGVSGLPQSFLRAGASAVVAPSWAVEDKCAAQAAGIFYRELRAKQGKPIARIVRDLRARSYRTSRPQDTWAAYIFFGHPLANGR